MIYETLEILKDQVSNYWEQKTTDANLEVLENVSKHDDPDNKTMNDNVVLSLLDTEEETALKNQPNVKFKNGETIYKNAPVKRNANYRGIGNHQQHNLMGLAETYRLLSRVTVFHRYFLDDRTMASDSDPL